MQFVAAAVMVLLSRLLRPFLLIRFGNLRNHTIGTLSLQAEGYVADRDLGLLPKSLDLFFHTDPRANRVLDRLLERQLHVTPLARYAQAINGRLPGSRDHIVELGNAERDRARDHYRAFTETQQHFALNTAEISEARRQLRAACGIPDDARFICFFSRTSSYLKHLHAGGEIRRPEEIPTSNIRDSSILDYLPAAEELAKRGYWCFRMGAVVDETIPLRHERIIDYANSFRSELLDIYLISHCDLILSDTTGLRDLAFMFRRPTATANCFNLLLLHSWAGLFMPKKYILERENRLFTLKELIANDGGPTSPAQWPSYAARLGLRIEDNSPEEILEMAIEAIERHSGNWIDTAEDQARQARVQKLYAGQSLELGGPMNAVLSSSFLRRHPHYLA
ncbi:MAG: TIGR04372 family glycosyltransferase [Alphaproteobacteria bacterium]|nr:TIGR04372 family glycosyltransferase [Alphaproteobacteria bacterium]